MATNEVFSEGKTGSFPVPAGTKSGDPVRVGVKNAVALTDRAASSQDPSYTNGSYNAGPWGGGNPDGFATLQFDGVWEFTVTGATEYGTAIYITPGGALNITETNNKFYGVAWSNKTAAAGPCRVEISGTER